MEDCKTKGYCGLSRSVSIAAATLRWRCAQTTPEPQHHGENARGAKPIRRDIQMTSRRRKESAKRMETEAVRRQQATLPGVSAIRGPAAARRPSTTVIGGGGLLASPALGATRSACRPASTVSRTSSNKGQDPDLIAF